MGFIDAFKGLIGETEEERRAAANRLQREKEAAAKREREDRDRHAAQMRSQQEDTDRARREVEKAEREKRVNEDRLRKEQKEMEASLLREHNVAMQRKHDENIAEMKRASEEKDALNEENRKREMEIIMKNEEKLSKERMDAEARVDKLNKSYTKTIEEKNKEVLQTKETMHNDKITMMKTSEKEKSELQKKHLDNLNEQQRIFIEQQNKTQEKFENETSALRTDAQRRERLLKEEKVKAEKDFQRQMKAQEAMTREERLATQKRHDAYIKSKDAAIDTLRKETEQRVEELQEANRLQQAEDLATLKKIENERIEREKEIHAQTMERERQHQEHSAGLYEKMIEEKERSHAMLFLAMKQRQDDTHQYQQILSAVPRALASEQQTSKLMLLKTKLHEIASNTDESITNLELEFGDYMKKPTPQSFASLEKAANDMNETIKILHRTVTETITQLDSCTSVLTATRNEWRGLLRQLQSLTSTFTRTSTKVLGLTKRKAVTLEAIDGLSKEFDIIKNQIYDLPILDEGSVMGMIEQKQTQIAQTQQSRFNMLSLNGDFAHPVLYKVMRPKETSKLNLVKDVYDQLLLKEKEHQKTCLEYDKKITKMQDQLYNRILEEKERSTQLTAAFMAQHQRMIEGMYALMTRMQSAVLCDNDCKPLSQLQAHIFLLGNNQLEAFNAFSVLTTNNKKTLEHIKRKALAKKIGEQCEEIRSILRSLESSLAENTSIEGTIKVQLQKSTAQIEHEIDRFLKVFGKLRKVLFSKNRGEDMHEKDVDGITEAFDRMQNEIISMPPLSTISSLEVIETGLAQLSIEDGRGQLAIANGSTSMLGWIGSWFG